MKKVMIVGLILVIITLILLFLAYSISKVKLEKVDLGPSEISLSGVDFSGALMVYNGGMLKIPLKKVDYTVYATNNTDIAVSGSIDSITLNKKQATIIPFDQSISWTQAALLGSELLGKDKFLIVEGDIHLQKWWIVRYKIHFIQYFNVKDYFPVVASG